MKYTVLWTPPAENALAQIWLLADDRDIVTHAADRIDTLLSRLALECGESREYGYRVMFERPLAVDFYVVEATRTAVVLDIWRTDRK